MNKINHIVRNMEFPEFKIKIDKQGRIVIPSNVRKLLGIKGETECILRVKGRKIVIEVIDNHYRKKVEEWYQKRKEMKIEAFSSKEKAPTSAWISDEYARKRLGLN